MRTKDETMHETFTPDGPTETTRFRIAYESCLPEIDAVPDDELVPITLDIPSAAATVLGTLPELRMLMPRFEGLPSTNVALIARLEVFALATLHAHTLHLAATPPAEPLTELVARGMGIRGLLHSDAMALAKRGFLDPKSLAEYRGGPGHKTLVVDLNLLASVMRERWPALEGKTAVQIAELDGAEEVAERLLTAIGEREMTPAAAASAAQRRQRAFTLLVGAYDEARRAVAYLRWREGDADAITPSLYAGRGNGNQRRRQEEARAPASAVADVTAAQSAPAQMAPSGMPDSSPFLPE